jgi:hypothetical protein
MRVGVMQRNLYTDVMPTTESDQERIYAMSKNRATQGDTGGWFLLSNDGQTMIWLAWRDWDLRDMGADHDGVERGWMVYTAPMRMWPGYWSEGGSWFDSSGCDFRDGPFVTRREAMNYALRITS